MNIHRITGSILFAGILALSSGLQAHNSGTGPSNAPEGVIVTRHFSGLWMQSEHQSQGFTLHVVHQYSGAKTAVAFWFTYGDDEESAWLMGQGPIDGNRIELELYRFSGIGFAQLNDPNLELAETVGTAVMEFDSCQTGSVTYDSDVPGMGAGSFRIEQFGWILNTHCSGGISDDMPADARHGLQGLELTAARDGLQGAGQARFESYPNHMEFEVETEGLADGEYHLYVGMHDRGAFQVREGHGEIGFSSPAEDGYHLLNFEPRGQRIEVHDDGGAVLSSFERVMDEDDHSPYRGGHGNGHGHDDDHNFDCDDDSGMSGGHGGNMGGGHGDECVDTGDYIELETELVNTGVLADASGEAEWEMNAHRIRFSVEIEGVPAGDYPLRVGGEEVGRIEAFVMNDGDVFGRINFRDPGMYGMESLDFDPRGQSIEVLQDGVVILEADFPTEP